MIKRNKIVLIVLGIVIVGGFAFAYGNPGLFQGRMFTFSEPLPAYDENKCYDSDGGKNYQEAGTIYGKLSRFEFGNKTDVCTARTKVKEYYCNDEFIQSEEYGCENGCDDGACKAVSEYQFDVTLSLGETYKLSDDDFLRLDEVKNATVQLTIWNTDNKGCRLVNSGVYLKDQNNHERYSYYKDWLIELDSFEDNSADLKFYTDDLAYEKCIAVPLQSHRCLNFKKNEMYKVQSDNFSRYFESQSYSDYNNLMLNYSEAAYAKLKQIFPSLSSAPSYGDEWNFISPVISEPAADSAWLDTAVVQVVTDGWIPNQLLSDNELVDTYNQKINEGDLNFEFGTEVHEWTHMFLYPTELGSNPSPDGSTSKLSEGIAEYIQSLARYYPDGVDIHASICGKDGFDAWEGHFLNGMTYVEAFNQGYTYDTGKCFFKKVENICGFIAIDSMLDELFSYQYEPFEYHSNLFKVLRDNCSNEDSFDEVMTSFGFSKNLLDQTYQQGMYVPIKEMACK